MSQVYNLSTGSTNYNTAITTNINQALETIRSNFSGASFPTNPAPIAGQPCFRTSDKTLYIYDGTSWVAGSGDSGVTWLFASKYATLSAAITAIGATETTLVIDTAINASNSAEAVTVPSTLSLMPIRPGVINKGSATSLTINSAPVGNPMHQWLSGFTYETNLTISGSDIIDDRWYGGPGNIIIGKDASVAATSIVKLRCLSTTSTGNSVTLQSIVGEQYFFGSDTLDTSVGTVGKSINSSTGTITNGYGTFGVVRNDSTGTITNGYGVKCVIRNSSTGTMTNGYGLYIDFDTNNGTITNAYGLYINQVLGTNKWGVYVNGATLPNFFAGNVGVGTATDFGGGVGVIGIHDATTIPTTNPTGGGILYPESGILKWRRSDGTIDQMGSGGGVTNIMRAYKSTTQSITTGTYTTVTSWTELFDTGANFDPSTGIYTIPTTGYYQVSTKGLFAANATNCRFLGILLGSSGGNIPSIKTQVTSVGGTYPTFLSVSSIIYASAGDTVEVRVMQVSGGNLNFASTDGTETSFEVYKIA